MCHFIKTVFWRVPSCTTTYFLLLYLAITSLHKNTLQFNPCSFDYIRQTEVCSGLIKYVNWIPYCEEVGRTVNIGRLWRYFRENIGSFQMSGKGDLFDSKTIREMVRGSVWKEVYLTSTSYISTCCFVDDLQPTNLVSWSTI